MITVETIQKLKEEEIEILKNLVGKKLQSIYSSSMQIDSNRNLFHFKKSANLTFQNVESFIAIYGESVYANIGDDYFSSLVILQTKRALNVPYTEYSSIDSFHSSQFGMTNFPITKIEIYGYNYEVESKQNSHNPHWNQQDLFPGDEITERIVTENYLLFYSNEKRMSLEYLWDYDEVRMTFDQNEIKRRIKTKTASYGLFTMELKHSFE